MTEQAVENYHKLHLDALVCIGGGGRRRTPAPDAALRMKS